MAKKMNIGVQNLKGRINEKVVEIYPELEDLVVEPSLEEQKFKSEKYGYSEVTVKAIDTQELNITPSIEQQVNEGLFDKVTVAGDSNLVAGNIKQGTSIFGVEGTLSNEPVEKYIVRVIDYDGTVLKEEELAEGEVFIIPDEPQHNGLIFQGWSSPVVITNNTVTVTNNDIIIGPMYTTVSGASEFDIQLNEISGLSITFRNITGMSSIDWGDGIVNTELTHIYADYGEYTIKMYDVTRFGYTILSQDGSNASDVKSYIVKNIRIANSVTTIQESFRNFQLLKTVTFPKGLKELKDQVFRYCSLLKAVVIPDTVTSIGYYFCGSCKSLTDVVIPLTIKEFISQYQFYGCYYLSIISLPEDLTIIGGGNTFDGCSNLKRIVIPKAIETIPQYCFSNCFKIKTIIPLGMITAIGDSAFYHCDALFDISLILKKITGKIENSAFHYCGSIEEIIIPEGITEMGNYCLSYCKALKVLKLPSTLTKIGNNGLQSLEVIKKIDIPETVTSIGSNSFSSMSLIEELVIPSGITEIPSYAFAYNGILKILDFSKSKIVPTLSNANAIPNNIMLKIVVPDELYDEWVVATNWSTYADKIYKASEVLV